MVSDFSFKKSVFGVFEVFLVVLVRLVSFGSGFLFVGILEELFANCQNLWKFGKIFKFFGDRACQSPAWKGLIPNSSESKSCFGRH